MNRLYPRPGETTAEDLVATLDLGSRAPEERPYVVVNMVSSLDGRAALDGQTRGLSSGDDRKLFHLLRSAGDALLVGAGTVRTERYGEAVKNDELRGARERHGLDPVQPTVIVSGRLLLPSDLPLLQAPGAPVVVATGAKHELEGVTADVTYERVGDDLRLLLARLRSEHGFRSLVCEGGPTLVSYLLAAGLIDELFLSIAPQLVGGGDEPTIATGRALPDPAGAELVWLCESGGELFTRWRVRG
ncbi:MAG TPA: dihydrofolate reductase family protein [Thermoleophilaceae bacterium]|nr:dihydrofolate reductase family protein [Thermoleophilaceae bacterium]